MCCLGNCTGCTWLIQLKFVLDTLTSLPLLSELLILGRLIRLDIQRCSWRDFLDGRHSGLFLNRRELSCSLRSCSHCFLRKSVVRIVHFCSYLLLPGERGCCHHGKIVISLGLKKILIDLRVGKVRIPQLPQPFDPATHFIFLGIKLLELLDAVDVVLSLKVLLDEV